jgi:DNA repair protein RadC
VQVAQTILQKFGSLNALALATVDELKQISGGGPDKAATLVAAFALARRMEQERREESPVLDNPATVVNFIRETSRLLNVESFQVLHRREIPIRITNMNVAKICAQLRQALLHIRVGAIPLEHGLDRKLMALIPSSE